MRKITFTKREAGTFLVVELANNNTHSDRSIVAAETAFRRMTELKNEGFKLEYEDVGRRYVYEKE